MDILTHIKNPELLDEQTLPQIKTLLEKYPYFQTLHLLLLKNLEKLELRNEFDASLRKSALYVGDRKKLFYLLQRNIQEPSIKEKEVVEKVSDNQDEVIIKKKFEDELILIDELQQIESFSEYSDQKSGSISDAFTGVELLIIEDYFEEKDLPASKKEIKPKTEDKAPPKKEKDLSINKVKPEQTKENKPTTKNEPVTSNDKAIFIPYPTGNKLKEDNKPVAPSRLPTEDEKKTDKTEKATPKKEELNDAKSINLDLIDNFIREEPRIVPDKKKMEENIDISQNSVEENDDLISERLAEIYLNQQLFSKAIYTYEKLCLKFPKKSTYFDARIEEVKKLINK